MPCAIFALVRVLTRPDATPGQHLRAAGLLLRFGFPTGADRHGSAAGAWDHWRDTRLRVLALLGELAHRQPGLLYRRQMVALLEELEREEGVPEPCGLDQAKIT